MSSRLLWIVFLLLSGSAQAGMMGGGMMGGERMRGGESVSTSPSPSLTAAERKGYEQTHQYCGQCHAPPRPAQHSPAQWPQVIVRMERYMQQQHRAQPDAQARREILQYLARSPAK